nr:MAG TPA_asm: hypothetical protein [Caudoviricetes sp.]
MEIIDNDLLSNLLSFCCLGVFVENKNIVFHGNANTKFCSISVAITRTFDV